MGRIGIGSQGKYGTPCFGHVEMAMEGIGGAIGSKGLEGIYVQRQKPICLPVTQGGISALVMLCKHLSLLPSNFLLQHRQGVATHLHPPPTGTTEQPVGALAGQLGPLGPASGGWARCLGRVGLSSA